MSNGQTIGLMGLAVAGLVSAPATVSAQESPTPVNTGRVSWNLGADAVTEYWFRGIAQENQGIILQPYFDVTFGLISEGNITLDAYAGTWNSVHTDNPTSDGEDDFWYESDIFAGIAIGLPHNFSLDLSYVNYYSPAYGSNFAEEIDIRVGYDDTNLMEDLGMPFILNPHALIAFEINNGRDAGSDKGTYLELGVAPQFTLTESLDYPLTLTVPVTAGFSVDDYYEDADGDDETFGFLDIGAVVSTPLPFIPSDYGTWTASAGLHYIMLGDSTEDLGRDFAVTSGDSDSIYATFGVHMSY